MKAKKALKRLRRVEALLSVVIDQLPGHEHGVRELLDSARTSVIRAKAGISSLAANKPPMKVKQTRRPRLTAEGRKRISLAVKKRWAEAKRTPERKTGTLVKPARDKHSRQSGSPDRPRTKPADRPLVPEVPLESNQERHAN
jgi:hypothetical protein